MCLGFLQGGLDHDWLAALNASFCALGKPKKLELMAAPSYFSLDMLLSVTAAHCSRSIALFRKIAGTGTCGGDA